MSSAVHVYPVADVIEHVCDEALDCLCGPTVATACVDDRILGLIAIHHSIDGREAHE